MRLQTYLKQFDSIAWYPSCGRDAMAMITLSFRNLYSIGIKKEDIPDCFLYTDYGSYTGFEPSKRFPLDLFESEGEAIFSEREDLKATAYNVKELPKLKIGFDQSLVDFPADSYYGRVFIADILLEHKDYGIMVTKLVYVFAENTGFAFDFLLKNRIKVKYAIHSCYGHGYGGGRSNGAYMTHILKDLGATYFVSDITEHYDPDIAERYLSQEQKETFPILEEVINLTYLTRWMGYDDTKLFRITGFTQDTFR